MSLAARQDVRRTLLGRRVPGGSLWRLKSPTHVGLIVASADSERVERLLDSYIRRFDEDFFHARSGRLKSIRVTHDPVTPSARTGELERRCQSVWLIEGSSLTVLALSW